MHPKIKGWKVGGILLVVLPLAACAKHDSHASGSHAEHPAHVEHIAGSDLSSVTLTERAMERIDLGTSAVVVDTATGRMVVPYSSIIYDPQGGTWVYTNTQQRTFVRARIVIDRIVGDNVYVTEGPPAGAVVASRGVAELYGTEFEVGH